MEHTTSPTGSVDAPVTPGIDPAHGIDATAAARPGVPMEAEPRPAEGAHWREPPQQPGAEEHLRRAGLDRPTPVVGTAQRPHGLSGLMRRKAYDIPEHYARHWALLLAADRVDVVEHRLGDALAKPLQQAGLGAGAERVRENPLAVVAGALVGAWVVKKVVF